MGVAELDPLTSVLRMEMMGIAALHPSYGFRSDGVVDPSSGRRKYYCPGLTIACV